MKVHSERGDYEAAAPTTCRDQSGFAWPIAFDPPSPDGRRRAEQNKEEGINPSQHADFPIPLSGKNPFDPGGARRRCHGFLDADGLRKGQPKHTEPVGHADAKVNRQSRRWHQPAIELGRRDDPLFGKETRREFRDMRILSWSFDWRRRSGHAAWMRHNLAEVRKIIRVVNRTGRESHN